MGHVRRQSERGPLLASTFALSGLSSDMAIVGLIGNCAVQLLTCSEDRSIARYDMMNQKVLERWQGHTKAVSRVAYIASHSLVVRVYVPAVTGKLLLVSLHQTCF